MANQNGIAPHELVTDALRDSRHWDHISPRNDDIIIATCYKAGTTLAQQIINLLIHGNQDFDAMRNLSPWVESSLHAPPPETIAALPSPRFLKTHLHPAALPWNTDWKYIYLARDGRDVGLSLFHHIHKMAAEFTAAGKPVPPAQTIPETFEHFWDGWVETGRPRWDFWHNVDSWWQVREQPNVLLLHFNDLTRHKPQSAEKIARFLSLPWNKQICDTVCNYSSIDHMRNLELAGKFGGAAKGKKNTSLINKGTNGRWQNLLSANQLTRYQELLTTKLEPECADWLQQGGTI